jgi:hypothetical protein
MLSAVAILGTSVLVLNSQNFTLFKTVLDETFTNTASATKNQESLVIENAVYHSSIPQFNFTLTNTGGIPINVTKIEIDSPTTNVTGVLSKSITNAVSLTSLPVYSTPFYSKILTVTTPSPSSLILPGQTFTTGIHYTCFTDPVTISATTSKGSVIKTQVAPNIGWYDSHWKFRKRITLNYTQIVGNPNPIQLDFTNSTTITTLSNPSFPFSIGVGTNRLLLVAIETGSQTVNAITYSGQTLIKENQTSPNVDSEIWYLVNPPSGKSNIAVTMSGSSSSTIVIGAYSFFGVDQTYPISYSATNAGSAVNSGSVTAYTKSTNSWVVDSIAVQNGPTITQSSTQIQGWNQISGGTISGGSSRVTTSSPPIAQTMSWSWTGNQNYATVTVEIRPSAFYNFPLLVNSIDTDLKNIAQNNGNDIVFTSCNGKTKLNHEIENYASSTGSLTAWVQVPNIYNSPNNIIYMYYGYSSAKNQQNVVSTWDSSYGGVWHFNQNPSSGGIQLDNVKSTSGTVSSSPYQITLPNFVVNPNINGLLLVGVESSAGTVSSVTYGGTPLTNVISQTKGSLDTEFWKLTGPLSGTANVVVTFSGSANVVVGAYSFFGVDQTNPTPTIASNSDHQCANTNLQITSQYANSWVVDSMVAASSLTSPSQTQQWSISQSPIGGASSSVIQSTPGTITFTWTPSCLSDIDWADIAVEVKAGSPLSDSTSNHNDLNSFNMISTDLVTGQIGGALNFDGSSKYLSRLSGTNGMPNDNSPQTGSIWFWSPTTSRGSFAQDMYTMEDSVRHGQQMGFRSSTTFDTWAYGGHIETTTTFPPSSLGKWHYGVYTFDGTTQIMYLDGVQMNTCIGTCNSTPDSGTVSQIFVGTYDCTNCEFYKGTLDEFRYSTIPRSANWISTEYNNQASPSTFYSIGPVELVSNTRSSQ